MSEKVINNERVIDFDIETIRYKLGKSDKYIEIDPSDLNLPVRFNTAIENIRNYAKSLSEKHGIKNIDDISNINTGDINMDISEISGADEYVRSQINEIFMYDVSSVAFGQASSLSVTANGEYYFEKFLNAVIPVINDEFNARIKKIEIRIKKYTDKKGQHPALKK